MTLAEQVNNYYKQLGNLMSDNKENKPSILEIILNYLKTTHPVLLLVHLVYIILICATLSLSYIVSFHWSTVVQIYADAHDVKGFGKNLKQSVEIDNQLNTILHNIMAETNGIRAYIYRYHNGLAAINNVPFFFQTNTHEVIAPGAARLMPYEQRMPASFVPSVNNQFIKNQCAVVTDADSDKNSQNYYTFTSRGAKAYIRCPIYMDNGDLFGFVGVDYMNNPVDGKKAAKLIEDTATDIGNIFETITKK